MLFPILLYTKSSPDSLSQSLQEKYPAIVQEIDSMFLECDTVFFRPWDEGHVFYSFKGIYFDREKRLRKYYRKKRVNDGSHEWVDFTAYYDEQGNAVYLAYITSSHCDGSSGSFYLEQGRIVSYSYDWDCGCCEDEQEVKAIKEQNENCFKVGEILEKGCNYGWEFRNFLHADTLVSILKSKSYDGDEEFGN